MKIILALLFASSLFCGEPTDTPVKPPAPPPSDNPPEVKRPAKVKENPPEKAKTLKDSLIEMANLEIEEKQQKALDMAAGYRADSKDKKPDVKKWYLEQAKKYDEEAKKWEKSKGEFLPSFSSNGRIGKCERAKVFQVVTKDAAILQIGAENYWIESPGLFRTTADGDTITLGVVIKVSGTHQYKTALGALRTIRAVSVVSAEELNTPMAKLIGE